METNLWYPHCMTSRGERKKTLNMSMLAGLSQDWGKVKKIFIFVCVFFDPSSRVEEEDT